ncbi:MAG: cell division protein ZapA [Bacteroidales bacterium]|nr:cell division protein ZapA [Bacteroidales bacterium]HOY39439.1 cell division protein ZapA [Bacteroidales bacterium]HQP03907.1 cell division protein ZapA [Bacteroidales bacterium]
MDEKLTIHVTISERTYPINIKRNDADGEARIRQAADLINNTVSQFRRMGYVNRDEQDYLAMSALQICLKLIEKDNNVDIAPIINKLKDISLIIDEILEKEQKVL